MATRRGFLKLIGGGGVVAAAGAGGFVVANGPSGTARAPWRDAGRYETPRMRALSYAILAPNPHNRQPWAVRLDGDDALTLFCDLDRRLPETDPFDRQIAIGLGAFLEVLAIAAAEDGYGVDITPFPDGEGQPRLDARPVATVRFVPGGAAADALFAHVLGRRTNKAPYEPRPVDPEALDALVDAARVFGASAHAARDEGRVAALRDLTWRAHEIEVFTHATNMESVDLMRIGAREVAANPDGIDLEGPVMAAGRLVGLISREQLADPTSQAFQMGLDMYQEMAMSAPAFLWIANENASRIDQLNAGRAYVRMNLTATGLGLAVHPWSQALQEYPEMADLHAEAHDLIGGGATLQMLVRVGHARAATPAPRWPLETRLV